MICEKEIKAPHERVLELEASRDYSGECHCVGECMCKGQSDVAEKAFKPEQLQQLFKEWELLTKFRLRMADRLRELEAEQVLKNSKKRKT